MRTLGELEDYIQDIFNDTSTAIQTSIRTLTNIFVPIVRRELNLPFQFRSSTITTIAATQTYNLPMEFRTMIDVSIVVGGVTYYPIPIANRDQWTDLNAGASGQASSDYPTYYFIHPHFNGYQISFYPIISSGSNTITINYYGLSKDFITGDFTDKTAGTVTIATAATAVVGVGTAFAATDVGRYIRFDTDGFWYRIITVTDATHLTIHRAYEGLAIAGGTYLLGTIPNVPGDAMICLARYIQQVLWEKREYFTISGGKASYYEDRAKKEIKQLKKDLEEQYDSPDVNTLERDTVALNPNDYPQNLG